MGANDNPRRPSDADPQETQEWLDALQAVVADAGPVRGHSGARVTSAWSSPSGDVPTLGSAVGPVWFGMECDQRNDELAPFYRSKTTRRAKLIPTASNRTR